MDINGLGANLVSQEQCISVLESQTHTLDVTVCDSHMARAGLAQIQPIYIEKSNYALTTQSQCLQSVNNLVQ